MAREELGARAHGARLIPPEFYRAAFEQATDGIFGLDPGYRITAVNARGCELLGWSLEELVGRSVWDFVPAEDLARVPPRLHELGPGDILTTERRVRRRDGVLMQAELTLRKLRDGGFIGVGRDVTERRAIEDRLRRSEKMMADIISFLPDATFAVDTRGVVIAWNRAIEVMTGVPAGDMIGQGDHAYAVPLYGQRRPILIDLVDADQGAIERHYQNVRRGGETLVGEAFAPGVFDGRGAYLWSVAAPLYNDAEERIGAIESLRDVTERKRDEAALLVGGELLRATLEAAADGILAVDDKGAVVHFNRRFAELWRIPQEVLDSHDSAVLRRYVMDQLEDPEAFVARVQALYDSPDEGLDTLWFRDGRVFERASCPMISGDRVTGRVLSFRDVTERKRVEAALQESERRYRTLFESASEAIFLMCDGRFADCNSRTLEIYGCTREQIVGAHPEQFSPPRQPDGRDSQEAAHEHIAAALAGQPQRFEWVHTRADGTPFDAEVSLNLVELAAGPHLLAIVRDVTDRKREEERRIQLERRLLHAQKLESLGVLAGGIAHDFNNLLMAMLGNLELAQMELDASSPVRRRVGDAVKAALRAADLTRQMLAYSGRGRFTVKRLNLSALVEENAHLFRASIARTTSLVLRLDAALPAVEADPGQVQQVVMNLITNASEAIGEAPGTITLSTRVEACDEACLGRSRVDEKPPAGLFACLEVSDTGCGMSEETQQRMFDPFFTTKLTGRGLGLAAVLGIVRGHRGAMLLESAPGRGSTVQVLIPLAGPEEDAEPAPEAREPAAPLPRASSARGTVLLVDDEEGVRASSRLMLEHLGFTAVIAANGEEAVEIVRRRAAGIDLVLLDLSMPRMDGVTALGLILEIKPDARVILCSGYDEPNMRTRVPAERLAGFLAKPYDLRQLQVALERALAPRA